MLGFNGGLIGARRVPTIGSASGMWLPDEQCVAKRAGIWPSTLPPDPYFANVSLLYSFNEETIVDYSPLGNNPIAVNDVLITNNQSPFPGLASAYFNGTSSYITIPTITVGDSSSNLTVEFWVRPEEGGRIHTVLLNNPNASSKSRILVDNFNRFIVSNGNVGPTVAPGSWHHLAFVRSSGVEKGYVNGVGYTYGIELDSRSYNRIGSVFDGTDTFWLLKGWLSNMRITPGVARYTADFTPPTEPFPIA